RWLQHKDWPRCDGFKRGLKQTQFTAARLRDNHLGQGTGRPAASRQFRIERFMAARHRVAMRGSEW
ncbi:hypothetical protein, partial [Paraburkholderia mimosarum]